MPSAGSRRARRRAARPPEARRPRAAAPARGRADGERFLPLLVPLAALVAYHNSFLVPFVFDDESIATSPELHQLSWRPLAGTTRPLVQLSLALNYAVGGLHVIGYHVVNLTIHVLAALVLYGLVARTLRTPRLGARWNDAAASVALAVSLVWTVHPLQTESVTYVVQRSESLMALCYLLTLSCVVRGAGSVRARRAHGAGTSPPSSLARSACSASPSW